VCKVGGRAITRGDGKEDLKVFERREVAVVNKQHHVSKGLEMGFLQSGKINDIFKNLRVFTTVER
jgi:hypothetical protein